MVAKAVIDSLIADISDGGNNTAAEMRTLLTALNSSTLSNEAFEAFRQNLRSRPSTLTYLPNGDISTKSYTLDNGGTVTVTYVYNANGDVETVTLSGTGVPSGIQTTKTLAYSGGQLSGVSYS